MAPAISGISPDFYAIVDKYRTTLLIYRTQELLIYHLLDKSATTGRGVTTEKLKNISETGYRKYVSRYRDDTGHYVNLDTLKNGKKAYFVEHNMF